MIACAGISAELGVPGAEMSESMSSSEPEVEAAFCVAADTNRPDASRRGKFRDLCEAIECCLDSRYPSQCRQSRASEIPEPVPKFL